MVPEEYGKRTHPATDPGTGSGRRKRKVRIDRVAKGGQVLERRVVEHGGMTETVEMFAAPDWRADAWSLERADRQAFGRATDRKDDATLHIRVAQQVVVTIVDVLRLYLPTESLATMADDVGKRLDRVLGTSLVAIPGRLVLAPE